MKKYLWIIWFLSVGCSSVKITDVQKTDNFSVRNYKTFDFLSVEAGGDAISPLDGPTYKANVAHVKASIARYLEAQGLQQASSHPSLVINIGVVVNEEVQTRQTSFANPADRTVYMGQRNYHWNSQEVEVGKYRNGTLTVHLVDPAKNELMWKGSAESVLPNKPKEVPKLIESAVQKLFSRLP
ncbi:MAG: DUF4136 domain-containing protein [Cyclobacteriaceae bacterium]|nr:DUF4136 domain-containing protein [Cyclobacteriaceae bacterium]